MKKNTIQATAETETEAEVKRAKFQQAIDDSYRGGEPCRVTVQRKEAAMLVKFSTLANGVFIEDNGTDERKPSDRCFRFDANGNAEYALFADLVSSNPSPRWYSHQFRERDFTFA